MFTFCCCALGAIVITGVIGYASKEEKAKAEKIARLKERNSQLSNIKDNAISVIINDLKSAKDELENCKVSFSNGGYVFNGYPLNEGGSQKINQVNDNIDDYIEKFEGIKREIETEISNNNCEINQLS